MSKLTIGFFNDSFYPFADGVIMVMDNYAKRLCKDNNVIVFVPRYHKKFDDSKLPYKVVRCRSIKVPFLDYSLPLPLFDRKYRKELKNSNLDIVHIHSPFTIGNSGLKYAKKHKIPSVATMHSQFKRDFKRVVKIDRVATKLNNKLVRFFNKCDECWAVNEEVARIYYEDYKYKKLPKVMNNATEMLPVENNKKAIKYINKKHNLKNSEKVFLFVGRINLLKNVLFIVDSLHALKKKSPKFKFKMLFVGSGQDEVILKNRVNRLGLNDSVIFCGKITNREELSYYYKRADLFLFPSFYDASSIVQIESASQSTPGLFIEGTATSCMITDNVNGYLSKNTIGAYSDKIIEIFKDKKLYDKVCKNVYIDIYKTWDQIVDSAYENYKYLIDNKREE